MLRRIHAWKYPIAVIVVLGCSVFVAHKDQKTRDQYEEKCEQLNARPGTPATHNENCDKGAENAARHLPRWYRIFGWPEGITTWAILLTLLAVGEQTGHTRVAAEATRESAQAALLNAQAVINAERAWIAVRVVPEFDPIPGAHETVGEHNQRVLKSVLANKEGQQTFVISCLNQGRTPARIIGGSFTHRYIDLPDNLPVPANYSGPIFLPDPTLIATGDSFRVHPGFKPEFMLERDKKQVSVGFSGEFLIFYGRIIYEDVFALPDGSKSVHETRWCFAYRASEEKPFVACGPPEYNGHT